MTRRKTLLRRACGAIMVLMNLALVGVIVLVLVQDRTFHYAGVLIYVMALYAFCALPSACVNLFRLRKQGPPVLSTAKAISLAAALMAMLSRFGATHRLKEMDAGA